jgi:FKBP-type peptidyl-prolyl cis-trans isomerase FkpA
MKLNLALIAPLLVLAACGQPGSETMEITSGLTARILQEGNGETAEAGQVAVVHYTGWLYDDTAENKRGVKFDSSIDRHQHFDFMLGAGDVIKGWDQGVVGMKVGEKRELTIAPDMAYGDRRVGDIIPPGSTLVFEIDLVELRGSNAASAE